MATHSRVLAWRISGTGGTWWAAVYGVAQSRTQLKRPSRANFYPIVTGTRNVLGLCREYNGKKLIALFNFCEDERTVSLEQKRSFTDLFTGDRFVRKNIPLAPYAFLWALTK